MQITKLIENGTLTLKLDGWLDTSSSPALGEEIEQISDVTEIVFDFDLVEYISSSGLRQVAAANKKAKDIGASFRLINVGSEVMNIFKLTGIDRKITISGK